MRAIGRIIIAVGFVALIVRPAAAFDNHFHACFSPSVGWGVPAPVIDGVLDNDSGWNQGFRYRFQNGMGDADVALQATSAGSKIYVSIEVRRDASYDTLDAIVVAFDVGGTFHRVIVNPNTAALGPPFQVTYDTTTSVAGNFVIWPSPRNPVTPTDPVETAPDNSSDGKFRVWTTGSGILPMTMVGTWTTEIAIPIGTGTNQLNLPSSTDIGMYVAVARADNTGPSTSYAYYSWPNPLWAATTALNLDSNTPDFTQWGFARIGDTSGCTGLTVTGLRTLDPDNPTNGSELSRIHNNGFQLTVKNESVTSTNVPLTVTDVTAKFSVGLWGVPLSWRNVAATAAGSAVPNDGMTHDLPSTYSYIPSAADLTNDHVCLMGEVDTTMGAITISQKSVIINTHWGPASSFTDHPIIQSSLLKPLDGAKTNEIRVRYFPVLQFAYATGEVARHAVGTLVEQLDWSFEVMHRTGRTLVSNRVSGPVDVPLGSFRQIIQHELPASFAEGFAQRHAKQRKRAAAMAREILGNGSNVDPALLLRTELRLFNDMMANDQEAPSLKDFALTLKGVSRVGDKGNVFRIEVPQGKDVALTTTAAYQAGGRDVPPRTCATCNFAAGSDAAGSFALVLGVALLVRRRRRGSR